MQHTENDGLFVRKVLTNYQAGIFAGLKASPVPGMPRIYEAIEDSGRLIVIESYLPGKTLQEQLLEEGPLPLSAVCRIAQKLCRIVGQLHARGIIHRDIKPSNIILSGEEDVKLLDLDAAKVYKAEEAEDTRLIGTRGYAAPEQYGFGSSSPATDIYAIGVLLNVLAAGKFPHEAKTADPALNSVIERCTRMEPEERYRSVEELEKALRKIAAGKARRKVLLPLLCGLFAVILLFIVIRPFQKQTAPSGSAGMDPPGIGSDRPEDGSTDVQTGSLPGTGAHTEEESEAVKDSSTADASEISAIARAADTGINHLNPAGNGLSEITDTVYCKDLEPGREYVIRGVLINKDSGSPVSISGKQITDTVHFTPTGAEKTAELSFRFDASALAGTVVVVFETITENDREIFVHADIDDADKTVYIPKLSSYTLVEETGKKVTAEGRLTTIIDTVTYEGLESGREYTVSGWLYDQADGKDLLTGGTKEDPVHKDPVSVQFSFIPSSSSGSLELRFSFDSSLHAGTITSAAEELLTDGTTVAAHKDPDDWDQMVFIPSMRPELKAEDPEPNSETTNILINDTVFFRALLPGQHYLLQGTLINKATKEPVLIDGEAVTAKTEFISTGSEPAMSLFFLFDAASLAGTEIAVIETISLNGILIASHVEISDEDPSLILK